MSRAQSRTTQLFLRRAREALGLCGGCSVVAHEEMEWRDKKQNLHQRADLTAIPRIFKRLIGKQPLGQ
jgi:hypothetical protein